MFARSIVLLCGLASFGCDATSPPPTHGAPSTALPQLSKEPILRIGIEGEPDYEFSQIANATRRPDGTIVVADLGSTSIRFFDSQGKFIRRVGRQGEGPGEYRMLFDLIPLSKGFLAFDGRLMRYSLLNERGKFLYVVNDPKGPIIENDDIGRKYPYTMFRFIPLGELNGMVVLRRTFHPSLYQSRYPNGAVFRDTIQYVTAAVPKKDGSALEIKGTLALALQQPKARRVAHTRSGVPFPTSHFTPFGPHADHAIASDRMYVADSDSLLIRVYDANGNRLPDIVDSAGPTPVNAQDLAGLKQKLCGMNTDERGRRFPNAETQRWINWYMTNIPLEKTKPARGRLMADGNDNVWVQDYSVNYDSKFWTVFNKHGVRLGRVELPGVRPLEIGVDYLLGVAIDELDVQTVVLYKLGFPAGKN